MDGVFCVLPCQFLDVRHFLRSPTRVTRHASLERSARRLAFWFGLFHVCSEIGGPALAPQELRMAVIEAVTPGRENAKAAEIAQGGLSQSV